MPTAPQQVFTLAKYDRARYYPVCVCWRLAPGGPNGDLLDDDGRKRGAKRALLDGETIWVSTAMKKLYDDRRDKEAWRRFMRSVDVIVVEGSLAESWREAF